LRPYIVFSYSEEYVRISRFVLFEEGLEGEVRQDVWRKNVSVYFYKLWVGERRFKVEVGEVDGPKEVVGRDNRVE
jgi:hypothetical protein